MKRKMSKNLKKIMAFVFIVTMFFPSAAFAAEDMASRWITMPDGDVFIITSPVSNFDFGRVSPVSEDIPVAEFRLVNTSAQHITGLNAQLTNIAGFGGSFEIVEISSSTIPPGGTASIWVVPVWEGWTGNSYVTGTLLIRVDGGAQVMVNLNVNFAVRS